MTPEEQRKNLERFFFGMDKLAIERFAIQYICYPESQAFLDACILEFAEAFSFPRLGVKED